MNDPTRIDRLYTRLGMVTIRLSQPMPHGRKYRDLAAERDSLRADIQAAERDAKEDDTR